MRLLSLSFFCLALAVDSTKSIETGHCHVSLGMQSGAIPDDRITASSYYENTVRPALGRAHVEREGGAWCPRNRVYDGSEYLEVDLSILHVVTRVEVQGRFGNGRGKEYAEQYKLQYWRPALNNWVAYRDGYGKEILKGNSNTYLAQSTQLNPPVVASRVRFVPYSNQPRTVCMRVEIFGCPYADGLLSYSMPDGDTYGGTRALNDVTYDGERENGYLSGGLGQLFDGEFGHMNFKVDLLGKQTGYEWVGWNNRTRGENPVEVIFEFDVVRNFSHMYLYTNNLFTKDSQVFSRAEVLFSVGGVFFHEQKPVDFVYVPDRIFENARNVSIKLHNRAARFVKLRLYFALTWIMISEVNFDSIPCRCNISDESPPRAEAEVNNVEAIVPDSPHSGLLVGSLITVGVVFGVVPVVLGILYYRTRLVKSKSKNHSLANNGVETRKVSMKMKDFQINMNISPTSNGYSRAKGKLYGHITMDDEVAAMYQEPYKGPIHNPGYYTLGRATTPETPLKAIPDTDDSVDYAVPDVNMTPPPPFSEVYTPPPPIPLSRPPANIVGRSIRDTPPPIPPLPPPPEQQYYAAPRLCQASNIQGVTGTVVYAVGDKSSFLKEKAVPEVPRHRLQILETIGEGIHGVVQLCEIDGGSSSKSNVCRLAAVKSLKLTADDAAKEAFRNEVKILSHLNDPNIVCLLGVVTRSEPLTILLEYMDNGDLFQFLRKHVPEDSNLRNTLNSGITGHSKRVVSYGAMIYMASQIASGMKYLEDLSLVHRDLATRNCLVGRNLTIKISDFGMSRSLYSSDYYKIEGRAMLPIRWMAWESVLQGKFSTKSDVWGFGVTLWEILTLARRQPYDELSDDGVIENVSHCYHGDGSGMILLPQPTNCPKEMYDMMTACWRANERQRPPFWEILMFLQRKNLGYVLDYTD